MSEGEFSVDPGMIVASLLESLLVVSTSGEIVYLNPAAEALLGSARGSILGRRLDEILSDSPWISQLLARLTESEEDNLRMEGSVGTGALCHQVLAEAFRMRDQDGQTRALVLCLHDLAQRASLSKQNEARARLADLDRLVASVAHELNNPLSGIRGAAQILGRKLEPGSKLHDYTEMIVRQADRMAELANSLMMLEAPAPQRRRVNIHKVLREVLLLEEPALARAGIEVVQSFDPSLPDVLADSGQLEQLMLNILRNAIAASPEGKSELRILTRMEHGYYVERQSERLRFLAVEVVDQGRGLDEETLAHMFSPLFSKTEGGHGMGLAVAQSIANAHGGTIEAENAEGGGALLRVLLPVATATAAGDCQDGPDDNGDPSV